MKPGKLTFRLYPFADFDMAEWDKVFTASKSSNLFYHSSFVAAAQQAWPARQPHGVVVGWSGDQMAIFLPYLEKTTFLGKELDLLCLPTSDRNAPIQVPGLKTEFISEAFDFLVQKLQPDLMIARSVQQEIYELLCRQYANFDLKTRNTQIGYIRYLAPSIECFWSRFKSKSRNQLKRKIRKSQESGLHFRIISSEQTPDGYSLADALEALNRVHKMRFDSMKKESFFIQPAYQKFYKTLCALPPTDGLWITFTEALHQDAVVGSMLGIRSDEHYIFLAIGFDPLYAPLSPGNVMIYYTLIDLIDRGVKTLDFKCGNEPYKLKWTKDFYTKYSLHISFSTKGNLLSYLRYVAKIVKKIKKVPAKLRKILTNYKPF